jgi:phosphoglycerate dehydrogenase-like enzyme
VPLTDETRNMGNIKFFEMVKHGSYLINASRGNVIDEKALMNALEAGKLQAAALDVFHEEPLHIDNPLRFHERTVLTPHVAGQTEESLIKMSDEACDLILNFVKSGKLENVVNEGGR